MSRSVEEVAMATRALDLPDPSKPVVLGNASNEDSSRLSDDRNNNAQEKIQLQSPASKDEVVFPKREQEEIEDSPKPLVISESPLATDLKSEVLKPSTLRVPMRSPDDVASSSRNQGILPHLERAFAHDEKDRSGGYAHGKEYSAYFFSPSAPRTAAPAGTEQLKIELDSISKRQNKDLDQATVSNAKMILSPNSTGSPNSAHLLPLVESDSSSKNRPKAGNQAASMLSTQVKPRCTPAREAVDPAKYFTLTDEPDGTKYACSKCGNVYKWRKSLNKHWKEKHDGETPSLNARPPAALLQRERFVSMPYRNTSKNSIFHPSGFSSSSAKSSSLIVSPPRMHSTAQTGKNQNAMPSFMFAKFSAKDDSRDVGKMIPQLEEPVTAIVRPNRSDHSPALLPGWPWMHPGNRSLQDFASQTKLRVPAIDNIKSAHDQGQLKDNHTRMFSAIHSHHTLRGGPLDLSGTLVSPSSTANDNILDLSCKGTEVSGTRKGTVSVQDEPLDFSTKPSSGKPSAQSRTATPAVASNFSFLPGRHSNRKDSVHKAMGFSDGISEIQNSLFPMHDFEKQNPIVCAACCMVCATMSDLNHHFARHHMNAIYDAADDLMNFDQRGIPSALTGPNGTQLYKYLTMEPPMKRSLSCVVCGMTVQWSWMLTKHFEQMHSSVQPNPYKKQTAASASASSAVDVVPHDRASSSATCHRCDSCSFATDSRSEFARHQVKHSLAKEKKELPDSSSVHLLKDDFDREEDVLLKRPDGSPFDRFSDGIIDLEGEGTAIVIPQAPEETSFGSVQSCISRSKSKDAAAGAKDMSASYGDLSFDEGMMISGENTAIVIPQAPEETSLGSSQINVTPPGSSKSGRSKKDAGSSAESLLPFKCELCEYRARWPSEMMQHMKNHSDEKPYQCPQCSYRSKWKWDVVKHLKRCGGGGSVQDVIDTSQKKKSFVKALLIDGHSRPSPDEGGSQSYGAVNFHGIYAPQNLSRPRESLSRGPPNVTIYTTTAGSDMHGSPSQLDNFDNCDSEDAVSEELSGSRLEPGSSEASQSVHAGPQCPFVGHSPAELKRHLRVHSDEKPYGCQTCCYSSKWKCDLKKHLKAYNHVSAVPLLYGGHGRKPITWSSAADRPSYAKSLDSGDVRCGDGADSDLRQLLQGGAKAKKGFGTGNGASRRLSRDSGNLFGGITSGGRLKCRECEFEAIDITSFLQHKKIHRSPTIKKHEGGTVAKAKILLPLNHHRRKSFKQTRVPQVPPSRDEDLKMDEADEPSEKDAEGKRFWESLGLRSTNSLNREKESSDESDDNMEDSSDPDTEVESIQCASSPSKCPRYDDSPENTELQKQCSVTSNSCESNTDTEVEYMEASDLSQYQTRRRDEDAEDGGKYEGTRDVQMNSVIPALKQPFSTVRRGIRQGVTTTEAEDAVGMSKRKRKLRTCDKCGYITDNLTTLQRHAAKHGSGGRHRCSKCDYSVDRQHVLDYHVKIVHEGSGREAEVKTEEWKCDSKLDKPSRKEKRAVEGSALVNGEGYKALNRGGKRQIVCTTSVITVLGHEMEMIQKGNKTWYNCIKCHFVSSNITNAVNHAKQHGTNKKYKCRYCDYSLNRQSSIVNHMNSQHSHSDLLQFAVEVERQLEKVGAVRWPNSWPGTDVPESYSLLDKMNLRWRKDVCIKCGFISINRVQMLLHRLAHGRHDKMFACDMCDHRSTSSRLLACHMKSHKQKAGSGETSKMLSCSHCLFQTVSATEYEVHQSSHDADCAYKLNEFSIGTSRAIVSKEHSEVCSDGKGKGISGSRKASGSFLKLRCRFCPYVSTSQMYFAIHMKHHNSSKKLSCSVCNFRANVRNVFYHHQKLHRCTVPRCHKN